MTFANSNNTSSTVLVFMKLSQIKREVSQIGGA